MLQRAIWPRGAETLPLRSTPSRHSICAVSRAAVVGQWRRIRSKSSLCVSETAAAAEGRRHVMQRFANRLPGGGSSIRSGACCWPPPQQAQHPSVTPQARRSSTHQSPRTGSPSYELESGGEGNGTHAFARRAMCHLDQSIPQPRGIIPAPATTSASAPLLRRYHRLCCGHRHHRCLLYWVCRYQGHHRRQCRAWCPAARAD